MIDVRAYTDGEGKEVDSAEISALVSRGDALVWVDVADPSEMDLTCLAEEFHLHPLAIEDVRQRQQRPKLEHYPTHSFVVAYTSELQEVDFFLGPTWLVSVRESSDGVPGWQVKQARIRFERTCPQPPSSGFLLYTLLDELVDGYFDFIDRSEDGLEQLEDQIFAEELPDERAVQQQLFDLRRRLLYFRRAVVPIREVLAAMLRGEIPAIDDYTSTHLQDVFDHVLRAVDLVDGQRELMDNAVEAHLAIISNRINNVMKKMTSWGAILLVSTLITGIYGMNFHNIPELDSRFGYFWALGLMVALTVAGYIYFKRKDWL